MGEGRSVNREKRREGEEDKAWDKMNMPWG